VLDQLLTLDDCERVAREHLPHMVYEFLAGAAGDEATMRWNRESYERIRLRPRVLEDVSTIDMSVNLFGGSCTTMVKPAARAVRRRAASHS
jgi:4-hydroxymandelate oxidase